MHCLVFYIKNATTSIVLLLLLVMFHTLVPGTSNMKQWNVPCPSVECFMFNEWGLSIFTPVLKRNSDFVLIFLTL